MMEVNSVERDEGGGVVFDEEDTVKGSGRQEAVAGAGQTNEVDEEKH
jgi:hypothetical protein